MYGSGRRRAIAHYGARVVRVPGSYDDAVREAARAAADATHCLLSHLKNRPRIILVKPERAACVFASLRAGRPVEAPSPPRVIRDRVLRQVERFHAREACR